MFLTLKIEQPVFADGFMNDAEKTVNIYASVPDFSYVHTLEFESIEILTC